ncbi:alpha-amylase family protein [Salinibacterium soli]|uniref:Beta-galactosidase trimerization domain-containing protein n=1 Tax=Antiquaquibacter soli TaxID=3064523 RepID=A0ABT9BKV8_9MICO|nr:alpha-amylase family protein [Protaetiibacter sp. WY-16]MDO7881656.1 beta-galactosidase trimerization domain-containing protein [Protaetiibacter sp. WY-16]
MSIPTALGAPDAAAEKSAQSTAPAPRASSSPHDFEGQQTTVTTRLSPVTGPDTSWWTTSRRRVFYDAHTPDWADPHQRGIVPDPGFELLSAVRPEEDLEILAEAGVDSVVLFAKCQYGNAYYPTEIGRPHSQLQGRDLFGEQLAAAHQRGIRVIAYYSNMWDTAAAGAHPDWMLVPSPSRGSTGRWPALCLLGPYRQFALDQVREIARRYPIDGLWSDILTAGPCVCWRCQRAFEAQYGRPMPDDRDDEGWIDLIHFSQQVLRDYLEEQRAVLAQERPLAALIPNFYATTFVDAVIGLTTGHLELADIGSSEGYTDWHGLGFPSFASSYISAGVQGRPSEVLVSRFVHTWDFTLRSEAQLRFEAFTVAAHGSTVSVDDQPYASGAIEPEVYRRLAPVFARIAERSRWLDGAVPERFAALYASQRSRELESVLGAEENPSNGEQSAQFPQSEPRSAPSDLVAAVTGTYRALVEAHLPVDLLDERPESLARLSDYRVVVLPDALSLSPDEVAALGAFVRSGGGLVVTGEAGTRDERGRPTAMDPALVDLLGVGFGERSGYTFPYVQLGAELAGDLGDWPLPHYGRMAPLSQIADDVRVLATRTDPVLETDESNYWHNNQPAPGRATAEPVIVERSVGAGRVVVSTARLGNNRARLGHGAYRDLLAELVLRAAGQEPVVAIEGTHHNTEAVVARRGSDLVVHLVTGYPVVPLDLYGAAQPAAIEDVARLASLTLRVRGAVAAARVVDGAEHPLTLTDGRVQIDDVDDWETLVFRTTEQEH